MLQVKTETLKGIKSSLKRNDFQVFDHKIPSDQISFAILVSLFRILKIMTSFIICG